MPTTQGLRIAILALCVVACVDNDTLTRQELQNQSRVDAIVSGVLFDYELDSATSYNIRKDGFVVISFDESVPGDTYTRIVNQLRSNPAIKGVHAQQSGREVCPLRF